jgi:hypothetical protein
MFNRPGHVFAGVAAFACVLVMAAVHPASGQSAVCSFPLAYPGDLAPREAVAAWMAARASARGLPEELPVMAALVESGMQNASSGHADSVGFFQMRTGIWNHGPYAGYPDRPELQVKWFLDQATTVRNDAMERGHRGDAEDTNGFGGWIDAALRPSKANRLRYQRQLIEARELIAAGRVLAGSWPFVGATPHNDAASDTIAAWMATRALAAGLPPELPIMASLVESGLQNLPSDGMTAGYFRISESIWNSGAYRGFPNDPELQIKWFVDQALAAMTQRIADGDRFFGSDSSQYGEWIADVERPAEMFRGRYQLRLDEARLLMTGGCMTRP